MTLVLGIACFGAFCALMACSASRANEGRVAPAYLMALAANLGVVLLAGAVLLRDAR